MAYQCDSASGVDRVVRDASFLPYGAPPPFGATAPKPSVSIVDEFNEPVFIEVKWTERRCTQETKDYRMAGADQLELATPILSLCHRIFTD